MKIVSINSKNIKEEHICCSLGNDKDSINRSLTKKNWMNEQFSNGLVFKKYDVRGKVFIEYMPIETVWKPIIGSNYMVINCLWVSGQYKGKGISKKLLEECIKDSLEQGKDGIVVVSSSKIKPYLTDKKFYLKQGFSVIDSAFPYFELLELKLNKTGISPKFSDKSRSGKVENNNGFTFIFSNQCPFMEEYIYRISLVCNEYNIPSTVIKLKNHQEAQGTACPWGTLGIYYKGELFTHELMNEKKFETLLKKLNLIQ